MGWKTNQWQDERLKLDLEGVPNALHTECIIFINIHSFLAINISHIHSQMPSISLWFCVCVCQRVLCFVHMVCMPFSPLIQWTLNLNRNLPNAFLPAPISSAITLLSVVCLLMAPLPHTDWNVCSRNMIWKSSMIKSARNAQFKTVVVIEAACLKVNSQD